MIISKLKYISILIVLVFTCGQISLAQITISSPYSRFGIGDLSSGKFARNLAMGGTEIGMNQPGFINLGNPAAYSTLWYTTYEAGLDFRQYELETIAKKHRTHTSSFSYFDFAFPVKPQKWGVGFGLLPYSKTGYSINQTLYTQYGDAEIRNYEGSGGLNSFHIGTGFKVSKHFSAGLNAEYLFGVINNDRTIGYQSSYYYGTIINSSTAIGWFHFKGGVQYMKDSLRWGKSDSLIDLDKTISLLQDSLSHVIYSKDTSAATYSLKNQIKSEIESAKITRSNVVERKAKSDWSMVLGFVLSPQADLHARNSLLVHSFRYYSYANPDLGILERDTIINRSGDRGTVVLPFSAGLGFSLVKGNRWIIAGDYSMQQWNKFSFLGVPDSLVNSWKVNAGLQYTPNDRAIKSYLKLIQYRLGFHYEQTYLKLNGKDINDIGVSLGFGLPIRKAGTMLHFTAEAGKKGTTQNELILEKYLKFTFGFTINDRWFVKQKQD